METMEIRRSEALEKPRKIRIRSPPLPSAYTPAATSMVPAVWQRRSAASVNSWTVIPKNRFTGRRSMVETMGKTPQLVGGLVAIYYFPIYWEFHHPN